MWRLAKSLIKLRDQVNAKYPNRDKSSDGSVGDLSHSQRKSDHNPNSQGVVTAIDIDRDLNDGHDARELVNALQAGRDPRIKYMIFERQITVKGDIARWKPYHGANAHNHHVHISVSSDPKLYDDERGWRLDGVGAAPTINEIPQWPVLKNGSKGELVKTLQNRLIQLGYSLTADGEYGRATESIIKTFQRAHALDSDGMVGTDTRTALGL